MFHNFLEWMFREIRKVQINRKIVLILLPVFWTWFSHKNFHKTYESQNFSVALNNDEKYCAAAGHVPVWPGSTRDFDCKGHGNFFLTKIGFDHKFKRVHTSANPKDCGDHRSTCRFLCGKGNTQKIKQACKRVASKQF